MLNLRNRSKNGELLSLLGATIASAGAALYFASWLGSLKLVLLVGGLVLHAAAMFYRYRLETNRGVVHTRWESALYWSCWLFLILLVLAILLFGGT